MQIDEIRNRLTTQVKQMAKVDEDDDDFTLDVHLFDYGYLDSFGATELISYIEEQFHIEITQKDLMLTSLNTINEISAFIQQKLEG